MIAFRAWATTFPISSRSALTSGAAAHRAATTGLARVAAVPGATSGPADVVAAGGVDLLIDERHEARVHDAANQIGNVAGAIDMGQGATEWATRSRVTFDSVEEQLADLWTGARANVATVDGENVYSRAGLIETVADLMAVAVPVNANGEIYSVALAGPVHRMEGGLKRHAKLLLELRAVLEDHT